MAKSWIAVDLDGTLAYYDGNMGTDIGAPLVPMMTRVKELIAEGKDVRIFTARAGNPEETKKVHAWLRENGLEGLKVTNVKDSGLSEIYDDRAVRVIRNNGNICYGCSSDAVNIRRFDSASVVLADY